MKRFIPISLALLGFAGLTVLLALHSNSAAQDARGIVYSPFSAATNSTLRGGPNADGEGLSCGTAELTPEEMAAAEADFQRRLAESGRNGDPIVIPVAFHVILNASGTQGAVTAQQISDQIDVLNAAFAPENISFYLAATTTSYNTTWFNDGGAYYNSLAISPATTLNIYSNDAGGYLGYVPFLPFQSPGSVGQPHDRVVILWSSVPGGSTVPYNEGDTATHEVGHYLGLYHTFQGYCSEPNDLVADTPAIGVANFGCPNPGHDTCGLPGLDDYTNFMDYVDDPCMDHFTPGQFTRVRDITTTYRPLLGASESVYLPIVTQE